MPPSSIGQEPSSLLDLQCLLPFDSILGRISVFPSPSSSSSSSVPLPSKTRPSRRNRRSAALAALSGGAPVASSRLHRLWGEFNRFLRLHCERRVPIGFGSIGVSNDEIRSGDEGPAVVEGDGVPVNGVAEFERPKKVLILMSDTGGGHRASAEAIKAAFNQEFGDEYQVRKARLQPSQIKVYGLPVRPSFVKPVPPKEAGNVPYVVDNGCGKFSKSPKEIANIVSEWFGPKSDELRAMSQNALKLARPEAVFKIVHDLHELVRQRTLVPRYSCST
ncbi:hypothetical protein B296_00049403 [Ensete ventricosum]|uniref:Diacylglycerol glucosyltransferase N-terminal domain-containing protein n=1 Tax=Ensete ventricosum TaxID=4639 RepID=A0A426X7X3_ENSVE|nr:hypothetical protein B296_00049403 [Ensete ventricosum]